MTTIIPRFICFEKNIAAGKLYLKGEADNFNTSVDIDDLDFYIQFYKYIFEYIDEKI